MSKVIKIIEAKTDVIKERVVKCLDEDCSSYGCASGLDGNNHENNIKLVGKICSEVYHSGCEKPLGIDRHEYMMKQPKMTIVRCDCGNQVTCHGFTTTCGRCGVDYNWSGTQLASRSLWGAETGESYLDIIGPSLEEDYL